MGMYLGQLQQRNGYINFFPIYRYEDGKFFFLSYDDRKDLLPESQQPAINFQDKMKLDYIKKIWASEVFCFLDFEFDDLEKNIVNGVQHNVGYKLNGSVVDSGKISYLRQHGWYCVLTEDMLDGDYRKNPALIINDNHVYAGLEVVIQISNDTVIGPFQVEYNTLDNKYRVNTRLITKKYVFKGYKFNREVDALEQVLETQNGGAEYTVISRERYRFIHINENDCKEIEVDVITDDELLASFRNMLKKESIVDGTISLDNIDNLIDSYQEALLSGKGVSKDIQEKRVEKIYDILKGAEFVDEILGDVAGTSSEIVLSLLNKYQGTESFSKLVEKLSQNEEFMSAIQRHKIIEEKIEEKKNEKEELEYRLLELENELAEKQEDFIKDQQLAFENNLIESQKEQLDALILQKEELENKIAELKEEVDSGVELISLKEQYTMMGMRMQILKEDKLALEKQMDIFFSERAEKALEFAFDGMLLNRMQKEATKWENEQNKTNYIERIEALRQLPVVEEKSLADFLVEKVQKYRPTYDKNSILNIFICCTQGFLTVFSGAPGTGKTSICKILASVLGLVRDNDTSRFIPVAVERGWTTKRDFVGYYNPLTKDFDKNNRQIFEALKTLDLEAKGESTNLPFLILLDEANLSPMEYYWADFMNLCDGIDETSNVNLGDDYCFKIPPQLRFLATINNDHTTEAFSPRLVDRAWFIRLPKGKFVNIESVRFDDETMDFVAWNTLADTFSVNSSNIVEMSGSAKDIYNELLFKCREAQISVSLRAQKAIQQYWSVAQKLFEEDSNYGIDKSIVALDYAVAQRILPHISGAGTKYAEQLVDLKKYCSDKNLRLSADVLAEIIQKGSETMQYFQYFA